MWRINKIFHFKGKSMSIIMLLLFIYFQAQTQTTFSKLFYQDFSNLAGQVWELTDGYAVLGKKPDTTSAGNYYSRLFVSRWDIQGNQLWYEPLGDSVNNFIPQWNTNVPISGFNTLLITGGTRDSINCGYLMLFNNELDTIWSRQFFSPVYLEMMEDNTDWLVPVCADKNLNNDIFLSCQIYQPETENDFCIFKFDSLGNERWHFIYSGEHESDLCFTLAATEDGGVIFAGGGYDSSNLSNHVEEAYVRLDSSGNVISLNNERPEFDLYLPLDMLLEDDGIVYVTSIYDGVENGDPFIYKTDYNNNLIWYGQRTGLSWGANLRYLTKTCQNNYICVGRYRFNNPENTETIYADELAYIVQFDSIGQVMWERSYDIVDSPYDTHNIYDFKPTSDGGYIMVGEATDNYSADGYTPMSPRQQAWVLKVDGCGCLVPGCDSLCSPPDCGPESIDTAHHYFPEPNYFLYGPNPVSETLNIYVGKDFPVGAEFVLYDVQGRLIKSFVPQRADASYVWGMHELAAGNYQLLLRSSGEIMQVEQLIKL
jgi:hypothetical protein